MAKAPKTPATKSDLPAVYAVTGSISPSDFFFYQAQQAQIPTLFAAQSLAAVSSLAPVRVEQAVGYTGTVSNSQKPDSDQNLASPNPGVRDVATLSANNDTLVVRGTLRVMPKFASPTTSDSPAFSAKHREFVKTVLQTNPLWLKDIAHGYASNIADAAIIWRNREGFVINVRVDIKSGNKSSTITLSNGSTDARFPELVNAVHTALLQNTPTLFDIAIAVELGTGAEVYPSQPFADKATHPHSKEVEKAGNSYGRILAERNGQAILHSQKVGNALRRIDTWYADEPEFGAISVEAFGVITTQREVLRKQSVNSFYDFFSTNMLNHVHNEKAAKYVIAMLIKGGVFGQKE